MSGEWQNLPCMSEEKVLNPRVSSIGMSYPGVIESQWMDWKVIIRTASFPLIHHFTVTHTLKLYQIFVLFSRVSCSTLSIDWDTAITSFDLSMCLNLCALANLLKRFLILIFNTYFQFLGHLSYHFRLAGPAKVISSNFSCVSVVNIL